MSPFFLLPRPAKVWTKPGNNSSCKKVCYTMGHKQKVWKVLTWDIEFTLWCMEYKGSTMAWFSSSISHLRCILHSHQNEQPLFYFTACIQSPQPSPRSSLTNFYSTIKTHLNPLSILPALLPSQGSLLAPLLLHNMGPDTQSPHCIPQTQSSVRHRLGPIHLHVPNAWHSPRHLRIIKNL